MCFEHQTNLENQCSLLYTANTEQPFAIGEWRFLGPTNHTSTYEQRVNKNLAQWYSLFVFLTQRDSTRLPRENMECILECSFPTPSEASSSQYEIECAICYSYAFVVLLEVDISSMFREGLYCLKKCVRMKKYPCRRQFESLKPVWSDVPLFLSSGDDAVQPDNEAVIQHFIWILSILSVFLEYPDR